MRVRCRGTLSSPLANRVPGLAVAIVENGEYEWGSGFGFADLENNAPASEQTSCEIPSIRSPSLQIPKIRWLKI